MKITTLTLATILATPLAVAAGPAAALGDAQIAHIAYTADAVDIASAQQALQKTSNDKVRQFAKGMVRDHTALNIRALAVFAKLNVNPAPNFISNSLNKSAESKRERYLSLAGPAFDRAYIQGEIAFHKSVNNALRDHLIPSAKAPEMKDLLETGMKVFADDQTRAELLAAQLG